MGNVIEFDVKTGMVLQYSVSIIPQTLLPIQKTEIQLLKEAIVKKGLMTEGELNEKV